MGVGTKTDKMCDFSSILKNRDQFLKQLNTDLEENAIQCREISKDVKKLKETSENIQEISNSVEHESLIPLARNIFLKGRIVHSGEYLVEKSNSTDSYKVLQTVAQTRASLQTKIELKNDELDKINSAKRQLDERIGILKGESDIVRDILLESEEIADTSDMPQEIKSDKGLALKVGQFYEIIEYED